MKRFYLLPFLIGFVWLPHWGFGQNALQLQWGKALGSRLGGRNMAAMDRMGDKFVMAGRMNIADTAYDCLQIDSFDHGWLMVTDLNGNRQWSQCYGTLGTSGVGRFFFVHSGKNNSIWAEGQFGSSTEFPDTSERPGIAIVKFDSVGNPLWYRYYGSNEGSCQFSDFTTTSDGGALLMEDFTYAGGDIPYKYNNDPFTYNTWLAKLDSGGNILWSLILGGSDGDNTSAKVKELQPGKYTVLIATSSTDSLLTGLNFNDSVPCEWFVEVDSGGHILSSRTSQIYQNGYGWFGDYAIINGNVLLAGGTQYFCSPLLGSGDFTLVKVNGYYQQQWCKSAGGNEADQLSQIIRINDSVVAIGGNSLGSNTNDLASCFNFPSSQDNNHAWFSLVNINSAQILWSKALCGSGQDFFDEMYYDSSTNSLYVLVNGSSEDGDFAGIAYNDSGNAYLFKYGLITTGINELGALNEEIELYPNPTGQSSTLEISGVDQVLNAEIFNMMGQRVISLFNNLRVSKFEFNIGSLQDGIYFIRVSDTMGNSAVRKLIVAHE